MSEGRSQTFSWGPSLRAGSDPTVRQTSANSRVLRAIKVIPPRSFDNDSRTKVPLSNPAGSAARPDVLRWPQLWFRQLEQEGGAGQGRVLFEVGVERNG